MSPAAQAALNDINEQLVEFKAKNSKRVDELEAKLDILNLTGPAPARTDAGAKPYGLDFANPKPTAGPVPAELAKDWGQFIRSGTNPPALQASMEVLSDPAGGFLVNPTISRSVNRISFDESPIRRFCRVIPMDSGDAFEEPLQDTLAVATWVGENQARTETAQPNLRKNRRAGGDAEDDPKVARHFELQC